MLQFSFLINTNACISIVNQASESKAGDFISTLSAGRVYGSVGKAIKYLNLFFLAGYSVEVQALSPRTGGCEEKCVTGI